MITSNVREIMERDNITYVELEKRTGLSNQTIARARGELIKECKLSTLEIIASGLEVRLKELFDDGHDGTEGSVQQNFPIHEDTM